MKTTLKNLGLYLLVCAIIASCELESIEKIELSLSPENLSKLPESGKQIDFRAVSVQESSIPQNARSFNRLNPSDTHYYLGKTNGKWGTGSDISVRESFREYSAAFVEPDGSLTIAWINIKGTPTKDVLDWKGDNIQLEKEITIGPDLMLSTTDSDGKILNTKTLIQNIDHNEWTGSFSGILKTPDGNYITAYRRWDHPKKIITKPSDQGGLLYDRMYAGPRICTYVLDGVRKYETCPDKTLADPKVKIASWHNDKTDFIRFETKNYSRMNVCVFKRNGDTIGTTKFYPTNESLHKYGLSFFSLSSLKPEAKLASYYDFGFAGRSRIKNIENALTVYSTIGFWQGDRQHQDAIITTFKYQSGKTEPYERIQFVSNRANNNSHVLYPVLEANPHQNRFIGASIPEKTNPIDLTLIDPTGKMVKQYATKLIADKRNGNKMFSIIGDVAVLKDRYIVSFTTANQRLNRDVGIIVLDQDLKLIKQGFVTDASNHLDSDGTFSLLSNCTAYGDDQVLLAWEQTKPGTDQTKPGATYFAVLDKDGTLIEGPSKAPNHIYLPLGGAFFTHKNGDIGWVVGTGSALKVFKYERH